MDLLEILLSILVFTGLVVLVMAGWVLVLILFKIAGTI